MFKETYYSPEKDFDQLLSALELCLKHQTKLLDADGMVTDDDFGEEATQDEEAQAVSKLIVFLKNNPDFVESRKQELQFVGDEYLEIGLLADLKKEFANVVGLKYRDLSPNNYASEEAWKQAFREEMKEKINKRKKDN